MFNKIITYLKKFDWVLLAAIILLICFGLAEIYSIALSQGSIDLLHFKKQVVFVVIGIILLFLLSFFDYYNFRSFSNYLYVFGIFILVGVLIIGKTVRGTTAWYEIYGFSLQPVEFIKVILIIFLARYFSGVSIKVSPVKHILLSGLGCLLFIVLVLKQPDLGSALILFLLWMAMIVMAGFKKKYIIFVGIILLMSFSLSWLFFFEDYQKERITTFINPSGDSLDRGYNIAQAKIAVGSGRITGRGIGSGSQSQLKFLPEAQNDFIFAVIAEELGFFGVSLIIFFFAVIYYRLLFHVRRINNDFGIYFLLGACALIFIEMFINIGMNIGLLPVMGISLPFLSSGGSSMVSTLMIMGIAQGIIIRSKLKY